MSWSTSSSRALRGSIKGSPMAWLWRARQGRPGASQLCRGAPWARLCLSFHWCKGSQQLPAIVRHDPLRRGGGQQARHRRPFVDKDADVAFRLRQPQGAFQRNERRGKVSPAPGGQAPAAPRSRSRCPSCHRLLRLAGGDPAGSWPHAGRGSGQGRAYPQPGAPWPA